MALWGGITIPGRPDLHNIAKLDLLPIPQIRRMMRVGVALDIPWLQELDLKLEGMKTELKKDITSLIPPEALEAFAAASGLGDDTEDSLGAADHLLDKANPRESVSINLDSSDQIHDLLFGAMNLAEEAMGKNVRLRKTKSGTRLSTGKKQMENIKSLHPIVPLILRYKEYSKLQNTYTKPLPTMAVWHDKGKCRVCGLWHWEKHPRIHGQIMTTRTAPGRKSMKKPNLQQIPSRTKMGREVRKAFVASKGNLLVTRDASQFHLRLIAHLAKEPTMIRIFKMGGDIHIETARLAFNLGPDDKVDKHQHRNPSKTTNFLVCLAEGQRVLTDRGLVPIQDLSCCDRVWDGEHFVPHGGVIFKGYQEVITYDGLTATPSHKVWAEGAGQIPLSQAMAEGRRLVITGVEDHPIRYSGDTIHSYREGGRSIERVQGCNCSLHGLWGLEDYPNRQHPSREDTRVQLQPEEVYRPQSQSAVGAVCCNEPALQQSKQRIVPELRGQGSTEQVQVVVGLHSLHFKESSTSRLQGGGCRSDQEQRALRAGELEVGDQRIESSKQARQPVCDVQGGEDLSYRSLRQAVPGLPRRSSSDAGCSLQASSEGNGVEGDPEIKGAQEEGKTVVRVYDILNAGPNHRFTCEGKLVSNCYGGQGPTLFDTLVVNFAMADLPIPAWLTLDWCNWFIDRWFEVYPGAKEYFDVQHYRAGWYGAVWCPFGRVRRVPEVQSCHQDIKAAGLRQGANHPIIAMEAGMMNIVQGWSETKLEEFRRAGVWAEALLPVHDEILSEAHEDWAEDVGEAIGYCIDNAMRDQQTGEFLMRVPMVSDGKVMERWEKE